MKVGSLGLFFFQAEDGIRDADVTGVQTCALPISGLGLVLAATSGCTGQRQAAPGASAPRSAWETVLAGIGQNGEVDQQTATQAFSLAVAPLPGVTVPNGPEVQIRSGSAAIRWVLGYLAQLPADLQQAVKGWLDRAKADGTTVRQARAPAQA